LPRRRFTYDPDGVPSLDLRIQAKGGPQVDFAGIVDSGAGRTVLSVKTAEALGLRGSDLREAGEVVVADGSAVPCFAPLPIRARVLDTVSSEDDQDPWGPIFDLDVVFLEHVTSPLWGQTDFFATFLTRGSPRKSWSLVFSSVAAL
jgi:hypothetical protein